MTFLQFGPESRSRWNQFVQSAVNSSVLQSYEWGIVKSGSWKPHYVALVEGDAIRIGALVLERKLPVVERSILYCPRGPIVGDTGSVGLFLSHLTDFAVSRRGILIQCDPEIEEADLGFAQVLGANGFHKSPSNVQPRGTILLDIRPDEDALLKSFHHKTRYNIRLAEKKGVVVLEENSIRGIDTFYELFAETARRDHFMILRRSYFHHLWKTLSETNMATVFVGYFENRPLAAIFLTTFGNRMTYLYGASSNEHRNLMPNHLVHWRAIEWARQQRLELYDLWGIPANPYEGHPLWGVYRFKKGFCETETRWIGTYQRVLHPFWFWVYENAVPTAKSWLRLIKTGHWHGSLDE